MCKFWIIVATASLGIATSAQAGHSRGPLHSEAPMGCPSGSHADALGGCASDTIGGNNSSDNSSNNSWKPSSFNYSLTDDETKPPKRRYDYNSIPTFPPGSPGAADKIWKENGAPANGTNAGPNSGDNPH